MNFLKIKETCLYVSDLEQTETFYNGKLGLEIISRVEGRHIFFRAGESVLLCFIAEATKKEQNLPPHFASGQMHYAFEISKNEYNECRQQIQDSGIKIEHNQEWPNGKKSFYFRDPDQHLVEVIEEGLWERK